MSEVRFKYHAHQHNMVKMRGAVGFYANVFRIPQYTKFSDWVAYHDSVKPIRGRSADEYRPVGMRRAVDSLSFSVIKPSTGASYVSFKLFKREVLRWHEDESIGVYNNGWMNGHGCELVAWLIPNMLGAYTRNKQIMAKYATDKKHFNLVNNGIAEAQVVAIPENYWFLFKKENGFHVPATGKSQHWAIDRQKAKKVINEYKCFVDYVNMCMNLARVESSADTTNFDQDFIRTYVTRPRSVLKKDIRNKDDSKFMEYLRHWQVLALSGEADKMKQAMGMFLAQSDWTSHFTSSSFSISETKKQLREVLLRAHADSVLKLKPTKDGKTPNVTYDQWSVGPASIVEGAL
jgi:hypothetical protein